MLLTIEQLPHDAFTRAASFSFFVFIIAVNLLWITVKIVLWNHGHRGWFVLHTRDLRDLKLLAASETNPTTRRSYDILRYALHTCFTLLFIAPLTLLALGSLMSHAR
ncbi:MAG: hypothetical protein QOG67_30 [Verrucomicrobiota bacterium]|jgi:hypothetical protein